MSIGQFPYAEQISFPPVDHSQVTPTVDDVAVLCATRTIDTGGTQLGTFTSDTVPTDLQVQSLILQAVTLVLAPLPDYLQQSLYPRITQAVRLQAVVLLETSFYREQANAGSIVALTSALDALLRAIEQDAGGGPAERVDSIVMRSTMAEYDPLYVMPPPPVVGGGQSAAWVDGPGPAPPQLATPTWGAGTTNDQASVGQPVTLQVLWDNTSTVAAADIAQIDWGDGDVETTGTLTHTYTTAFASVVAVVSTKTNRQASAPALSVV